MNKILVIGAGYLGSEIRSLLATKHEVLASSRSGKDGTIILDVLKSDTFLNIPQNIDHVIYCVSAENSELDSYKNAYSIGVENILAHLKDRKIHSFTFVSSTGVYKENIGGMVDESSDLVSEPEDKSINIVEGERLTLNQKHTLGRVCRLSGIYGPGRDYFIRFAEQYSKARYDEPPTYSNRIHKTDGARAIEFLIESDLGGIWNVSDTCPSERLATINYIREMKGLDLIPISEVYEEAMDSGVSLGKKVSSVKLVNAGFKFLYPTYREGYVEMLGI